MSPGALARLALLVLGVVLVGAVVGRFVGDDEVHGFERDTDVYRGLGAWVDVFDYAPAYQVTGTDPLVTPADVEVMADHGVRTLFIQASRLDARSPGMLVDEDLLGQFLEEAHDHDMRVVGWYLPKFADVDADLQHALAVSEFEHDGHRFDGLALDIESTDDVKDHVVRNQRLLSLSRQLHDRVGSDALGAVVLPPVQLDVVNRQLWPEFPWRRLAGLYDVWLPMSYWTFRTEASGFRDASVYTTENVRRLRQALGDPKALVHPIGGIADEADEADVRNFVTAATEAGAVGASLYDFRTTDEGAWALLQAGISVTGGS